MAASAAVRPERATAAAPGTSAVNTTDNWNAPTGPNGGNGVRNVYFATVPLQEGETGRGSRSARHQQRSRCLHLTVSASCRRNEATHSALPQLRPEPRRGRPHRQVGRSRACHAACAISSAGPPLPGTETTGRIPPPGRASHSRGLPPAGLPGTGSIVQSSQLRTSLAVAGADMLQIPVWVSGSLAVPSSRSQLEEAACGAGCRPCRWRGK
jgi:hypothetical protein